MLREHGLAGRAFPKRPGEHGRRVRAQRLRVDPRPRGGRPPRAGGPDARPAVDRGAAPRPRGDPVLHGPADRRCGRWSRSCVDRGVRRPAPGLVRRARGARATCMPFLENVTRGRGIPPRAARGGLAPLPLAGRREPDQRPEPGAARRAPAELAARGIGLPVDVGQPELGPVPRAGARAAPRGRAPAGPRDRDERVLVVLELPPVPRGPRRGRCSRRASATSWSSTRCATASTTRGSSGRSSRGRGARSATLAAEGVALALDPAAVHDPLDPDRDGRGVGAAGHVRGRRRVRGAAPRGDRGGARRRRGRGVAVPAWALVYQSRSGSPHVPWLEPDINDALRAAAGDGMTRRGRRADRVRERPRGGRLGPRPRGPRDGDELGRADAPRRDARDAPGVRRGAGGPHRGAGRRRPGRGAEPAGAVARALRPRVLRERRAGALPAVAGGTDGSVAAFHPPRSPGPRKASPELLHSARRFQTFPSREGRRCLSARRLTAARLGGPARDARASLAASGRRRGTGGSLPAGRLPQRPRVGAPPQLGGEQVGHGGLDQRADRRVVAGRRPAAGRDTSASGCAAPTATTMPAARVDRRDRLVVGRRRPGEQQRRRRPGTACTARRGASRRCPRRSPACRGASRSMSAACSTVPCRAQSPEHVDRRARCRGRPPRRPARRSRLARSVLAAPAPRPRSPSAERRVLGHRRAAASAATVER